MSHFLGRQQHSCSCREDGHGHICHWRPSSWSKAKFCQMLRFQTELFADRDAFLNWVITVYVWLLSPHFEAPQMQRLDVILRYSSHKVAHSDMDISVSFVRCGCEPATQLQPPPSPAWSCSKFSWTAASPVVHPFIHTRPSAEFWNSISHTVECVSVHNSQLTLYLIAILENTDFVWLSKN